MDIIDDDGNGISTGPSFVLDGASTEIMERIKGIHFKSEKPPLRIITIIILVDWTQYTDLKGNSITSILVMMITNII